MMRVLKQIMLLTAKDLRIEARSRQTLGLVIMLGGPRSGLERSGQGSGFQRDGDIVGGVSVRRGVVF